ncbi:HTTM domain-containing protein [Deinococcus planocerae]|uniref:HTTM domain-containing protein n=1 Tax=Deinococcus planocerae TaxID=1737569 RepID=UPI0011AF84E3|nr:hypothetical protein [Deinococcus planocerae]
MELKGLIHNLFDTPRHVKGTRILLNIISIYFIYRFSTETTHLNFIYSTGIDFKPGYATLAMVTTLVCSILIILGRFINIALLLNLISFWYLSDTSISGDGGDNILRIVLVYLVFVHPKTMSGEIKPGFRVFLHNAAIYAVILQVMILYFVAGSVKMQGSDWYQGTAMYYVLSTNEFGPGSQFVRELFKNPWVSSTISHITMIYQIGFPFMIHNRYHLVWALMGVFFHIGIGATMGLFTFSLVMTGLILFTINDQEWNRVYAMLGGLRKFLPKRRRNTAIEGIS